MSIEQNHKPDSVPVRITLPDGRVKTYFRETGPAVGQVEGKGDILEQTREVQRLFEEGEKDRSRHVVHDADCRDHKITAETEQMSVIAWLSDNTPHSDLNSHENAVLEEISKRKKLFVDLDWGFKNLLETKKGEVKG